MEMEDGHMPEVLQGNVCSGGQDGMFLRLSVCFAPKSPDISRADKVYQGYGL